MLLSIVIDGKRMDNSAIDLLVKELLKIPALSKNARDNCVDRKYFLWQSNRQKMIFDIKIHE